MQKLEDIGLLREYRGRWQYKFRVGEGWYTAQSKEDAVQMATQAYNNTPDDQRISTKAKDELIDQEKQEAALKLYGHLTLCEIESRLLEIDYTLHKLSVKRAKISQRLMRSANIAMQQSGLCEERELLRLALKALDKL
jgi:hypothetical protein